jgi:predicted nucleic acid-binding protein
MAETFRQPYLDSSVYIAAIRQEADRVSTAERILHDARAGQIQLVASTFVITEVYKGRDSPPLTPQQEQTIDDYFQHEFITWVELDMLVARDARRLARQHGLKPPDAVHLASAIKGGADQLLRWDDKFRLKDGHYEGVTVCEPHLVGRPEPLPGLDTPS